MLSRAAIKLAIKEGSIVIDPFVPEHVGPNSVDLRIGFSMKTFTQVNRVRVVSPHDGATYDAIDPKRPPSLVEMKKLPDSGGAAWLLQPGKLYLGETLERFGTTRNYVPVIDGRSTAGRLGIQCHMTAGVGDVGFVGKWTLEITVQEPIIVRPGDRLMQVYFFPCWKKIPLGKSPFHTAGELESEDLYGEKGHHYDKQGGVRGPAALD